MILPILDVPRPSLSNLFPEYLVGLLCKFDLSHDPRDTCEERLFDLCLFLLQDPGSRA